MALETRGTSANDARPCELGGAPFLSVVAATVPEGRHSLVLRRNTARVVAHSLFPTLSLSWDPGAGIGQAH